MTVMAIEEVLTKALPNQKITLKQIPLVEAIEIRVEYNALFGARIRIYEGREVHVAKWIPSTLVNILVYSSWMVPPIFIIILIWFFMKGKAETDVIEILVKEFGTTYL